MKHIYANLSHFNIPAKFSGASQTIAPKNWAKTIFDEVNNAARFFPKDSTQLTFFVPEGHLLNAAHTNTENLYSLGGQGVHFEDFSPSRTAGFTALHPASALSALGANSVIIGHANERQALTSLLEVAGVTGRENIYATNRILNKCVKAALAQGLKILYCTGEIGGEEDEWIDVIHVQIALGLATLSMNTCVNNIVIAYEPAWLVNPALPQHDFDYVVKNAEWLKKTCHSIPFVCGGLTTQNATEMMSIKDFAGGLISLNSFSSATGFSTSDYLEIARIIVNA